MWTKPRKSEGKEAVYKKRVKGGGGGEAGQNKTHGEQKGGASPRCARFVFNKCNIKGYI